MPPAFANLALAQWVPVDAISAKATTASVFLRGGEQIDVLDVVDTKKEIEKIDKQIVKLEQHIKATEGKLNNKSFVDKAPKDVVKRERSNLEERRSQHAALTTRRQELQQG